ncbi:cbb3-type cytochrome c oxidase subunit 3 [Parasulfuritortus cantonensis]|uniref:Cbb3-type cytochrome c oxidase subunit 3 n=1 Tax=Parasulfuritortus cantonensis TaxID=2528202 RepID=A0A4R1BGH6_9PROT|nr:cbb3-type cytochrome c oxidase subunit 3 [Parasulfuritortus cantonensis]TCJ16293.1 cbb3-type cytochrome c oxidase subunit 3 [Parasulfuritortus cantonensis]
MDSGIIGSVVTVVFFLLFVGIVWWAYHKDNRQKFEDAANLPFEEGDDGIDRRRS